MVFLESNGSDFPLFCEINVYIRKSLSLLDENVYFIIGISLETCKILNIE